MDAEKVLNLFDFYWFHNQIFRIDSIQSPLTNPDFEIVKKSLKPEISRLPSNMFRSQSHDELASKSSSSSSSISDYVSPKSVLFTHKLQTINSGKEVSEENPNQEQFQRGGVKTEVMRGGRKKKKKGSSKSLSDLEFEELKGFMDLGFVFTEDDKDSSLGSIIPGLQRLGKKDCEKEDCEKEEKNIDIDDDDDDDEQHCAVQRPYLSEAWEVLDHKRKEEKPLMNWRVPSLDSEVAMKDNLRCWAHSVASAVVNVIR